VRFPRIQLPVDCEALVALRDQDGRTLEPLAPGQLRRYQLQRDRAGAAGYVLDDGGFEPRFAPFVVPGASVGVTPVNAGQTNDVYQRENMPIRQTIVGALAAGGTLTVGSRYQAFATWWYAGRFGPPSNIVEVTPTTGNQTLSLTNLPTMPSTDYGRRLCIFLREGEGGFYLTDTLLTPTSSTRSITATFGGGAALRPTRWDEVYQGLYQYIRVYPRPTEMQRLELEYRARPRDLIEDSDVPDIPGDHDVLVWLTVAHLVHGVGGNATGAFVMADKFRQSLLAHTHPQTRHNLFQRGQVGLQRTTIPWVDSVDWQG
jgi:hypothetical protein